MNILTERQIGYHAAAIDSEGTISIGRQNKNKNIYILKICIYNTNMPFLKYLRFTSGLGSIYSRPREGNRKPIWSWQISKYEIKDYLEAIIDSLIIKKQQAKLMLEFLPLVKDFHSQWNPIPLENIIHRELIWEEMKILNKRGPSINDNGVSQIPRSVYSPKLTE